jgi:hypothetical protein
VCGQQALTAWLMLLQVDKAKDVLAVGSMDPYMTCCCK